MRNVQRVLTDLQQSMTKTRVTTALVLYRGATPGVVEQVHSPNVYWLSVQAFLDSLRHSGFGALVRALHNRNVDGVR